MKKFSHHLFIILLFTVAACKKEKSYTYQVNDQTISQEGTNKSQQKNTTEFISIAYSDLFGKTIDNTTLASLSLIYAAQGDKKLTENMIIKNFLNTSGVQIPKKEEMKKDVGAFVTNAYKKFFNRTPNEFEKWSMTNFISSDTTITPELIYYSMMTSNEYRYY